MAKLIAIYKTPKNPAAFDAYYFARHVPLAKTIPGLRKYDVNSGPVGSAAGPSGVHLIASLYFDSLADIEAGLASAQGQAAAGDIGNFADGGVDLYFYDTREV